MQDIYKRIQVNRLIDIRRFDQAKTLLSEMLAADPDDHVAHELMGRVALELKDLSNARPHIEKALSADPASPTARTLMFHYLVAKKNLAEAEQVVRGLVTDFPDTAIFHRFYAELALLGLRMDRVAIHIDEALRLDPADIGSQVVRSVFDIREGRTKEGGDRLRALIREHPESEDVATGLCFMLMDQGRYADALEIGRQLLRARPGATDLVEALITLKIKSHWSTIPLRPFYRFGNAGLYGTILGIYGLWLALKIFTPYDFFGLWVLGTFGYLGYSTVYPKLLRRWFRARGI